jgi:hypothetical protein
VRRVALVVAFVGVMLCVVVGGHAYLDARLAVRTALPSPLRDLVGAAVACGALLLIAQPLSERLLSVRTGRWIAWPASIWMGVYYSGADAWVEVARRLGMLPLRNARVAVERDGSAFDLAGVEDHHAHLVHATHRSDVTAALLGRDPRRPVVLLAHDPLTFREAARSGVDLQLSGHTHGGQIWPFRWLVRLSTPFVAGWYRRGDAQLYVSRGTGFWGPAMRLFAPAEITEITIRAGGAGRSMVDS